MRKALFILGELKDTDVLWLSRTGVQRGVATGETLITQGRAVSDLFFVIEGSFAVTTLRGQVATLSLGDVIGEMSFVEKRLPAARVTASEPSRVLAVQRDVILAAFATDAAFAARFYRALAVFLSDRLRGANGEADNAELDEAILDTIHQAGDRFVRLLALLEGRES